MAGSIFDIDPEQWDACAGTIPWVRHGFFRALELSGCFGDDRGVIANYVTLRDRAGTLVACAPGMLKWSNKREFGPEILWLTAGLEAGLFSWPKFQVGTAFYHWMAPKVLLHPDWRSGQLEADFLEMLHRLGERPDGRSAFNVMHIPRESAIECTRHGALVSAELRAAWHNPGVESFGEYVRRLPGRKRRRLITERRQAAALGLKFDMVSGADVSDELIGEFFEGFRAVCERHGNQPWVPAEMFRQLCIQMPDSVRLMTAFDGDRYVAGGFFMVGGDVLYFDTWSEPGDHLPGLVFEMACYRPIEYGISNGYTEIDAGLFAEYKSVRGFVVEPVCNAHWFYTEEMAALAAGILQRSSE